MLNKIYTKVDLPTSSFTPTASGRTLTKFNHGVYLAVATAATAAANIAVATMTTTTTTAATVAAVVTQLPPWA